MSRAGESDAYVPALRFHGLTAAYDSVARVAVREAAFKRALLGEAQLQTGQRVLDLGSGTGTLAILAKRAERGAEVVGVDADPGMARRAARKAEAEGEDVEFVTADATDLPFATGSVDRVLSTLFFHHLDDAGKRSCLAEVARVLAADGELHVADWGRAASPLMWGLSWTVRLFDGLERTAPCFAGELPGLFEAAGLEDAREGTVFATAFGSLRLYHARKARLGPSQVGVPDSARRRRDR